MSKVFRVGLLYSVGSPWARQLAIQLSKFGCEVHFFSFDSEGSGLGYLKDVAKAHQDTQEIFRQHNIRLHKLPVFAPGLLKYLLAAPYLFYKCKSLKIDSLLALYAGGFGFMAMVSLVRPYALFTVGDDILVLRGLRATLVNWALASASKIFSHGGYLAKRTQLRTSNPVENIVFGIDPGYFRPDPSKRKSRSKIICTRGFEEIYNNHFILEAISLLPPDLDFEIIFSSAGSLLKQEREFAESLPAFNKGKVKFLGGVSRDTLLEELQSSTYFISASLSDGAAISVQEALSCGLYPILSDIPSNREWLQSSENNGVMVPLHQPQVFAKILKESLCLSDVVLEKAAILNRNFILEHCHADKNTERIVQALRSLK